MGSLGVGHAFRNRSGSAASYTTSDSGDVESLPSGQSYNSGILSSSPQNTYRTGASSSGSTSTFSASPSPGFSYSGSTLISSISNPASALSPIASRVREHDANAMEAYLRRNRSGSGSTDAKTTESTPSPAAPQGSNGVSSGPSANEDDLASLPEVSGSIAARRRLRPSFSAAQLRRTPFIVTTHTSSQDRDTPSRNRSGTNPTVAPSGSMRSPLSDSFGPTASVIREPPSRNSSLNALSSAKDDAESEKLTGPPSEYAVFPDPPGEASPSATPTASGTHSRRLPFHLLSKPLPSLDLHHGHGHRRGASIQSLR